MMNRMGEWMGGWPGGLMWIWGTIGVLMVVALAVMIGKISNKKT